MTMHKTEITRGDLMPIEEYAQIRKQKRAEMLALKRNRRMSVGPYATFYFENFDTMLYQVHEMLLTEKGGEAQIADELAAYNPLVPNGRELVATMMLEIPDAGRRAAILATLGHIEDRVTLKIGAHEIAARPEMDAERTDAAGKTSSVHFLHFPMTDEQCRLFKSMDGDVILSIAHENYGHLAVMPGAVREALSGDLD